MTSVKKGEKFFSCILFLVFIFLMALTISQKINYHVDEISSYTLANDAEDLFLTFKDYQAYTPAESVFLECMTASADHLFDYANVVANQASDVHPPLYYLILHTICSFFPGTFSKWYAGVINIAFGALTLFFVRKLVRTLTASVMSRDHSWLLTNLVSIAFILCAGVYEAIPFLRMYIMAMCWVTATSFLLVHQIGQPKQTRRFYISCLVVTFLGAMTHYYCIVYTVMSSIAYMLVLLVQKKWKEAGGFFAVMAVSGIVSVAVYPAMLQHMFSGYRGKEALENLAAEDNYLDRLHSFFNFLSESIFGGTLAGIFIFMGLLAICKWFLTRRHDSANTQKSSESLPPVLPKEEWQKIFCVAFPCILYFVLISRIASYVTDRYLFPIYAVSLVWVLVLLALLIWSLFSKKNAVLLLCAAFAFVIATGWQQYSGSYLLKDSGTLLKNAAAHTGVDCLCIYDPQWQWKAEPSFKEVSYYGSITFVPMDHLDELPDLSIASDQEMVVLLIEIDNPDEYLHQIMELYPQLTASQSIGSYGFGDSYYLAAEP